MRVEDPNTFRRPRIHVSPARICVTDHRGVVSPLPSDHAIGLIYKSSLSLQFSHVIYLVHRDVVFDSILGRIPSDSEFRTSCIFQILSLEFPLREKLMFECEYSKYGDNSRCHARRHLSQY